MMIRRSAIVGALVTWGLSLSAYQGWKANTPGVFDDVANWSKNPAYVDLSSTSASGDSFDANLALPPTGVYSLSQDLVINRLCSDSKNRNFVLDLNGHTLTSLGRVVAEALFFRGGADGSSMTFTNGTVVIPPSPYQSYDLANNCILMNRNQGGVPTNVTLTITGPGSSLTAPVTTLNAGKDNTICVANGATFETALTFGGGDHLVVRVDGGTFRTLGSSKVLSVGTAASVSNEFVLANGGVLGNMDMHQFNIGTVAGALAAHLVLEGTETVVTITNAPTIGAVAGTDGSGYRVQGGATLKFVEDSGANLGRFWMKNGSEIYVTGAGSKLMTEATYPAICGNGLSQRGCVLRVTDHAQADFKAFSLGANGGYDGNRATVDGGAELRVRTTLNIGGQLADTNWSGETPCASNRVDVLSGGVLTVDTECWVGSRLRSKDNSLVVDGAGSRALIEKLYLGVSNSGYPNLLEVSNGGVVTSTTVSVRSANSCIRLSGGRLVTETLEFNAGGQKLVFEFPTADAEAGPFVEVQSVALRNDMLINIVAPGTLSTEVEKVALLRSSGTLKIPEMVLSALDASVPNGFRLYKTANEVGFCRRKGLMVILR